MDELRNIGLALFDLQYTKNGLYGKNISYRLVSNNKYFQVVVFRQSVMEKVWDIYTEDELKKFKSEVFDV